MRAKLLDDWTADFLAGHPSATVLHLACGLDTRAQRMAFGSGVRWVDVDLPAVAALRERLLDAPAEVRAGRAAGGRDGLRCVDAVRSV